MDVRQYFEPVDFSRFSEKEIRNWKYSMGKEIEKSTLNFTISKISKVEIVLFGVPFDNGETQSGSAKSPDKIRENLYMLANQGHKTNIVDFGNLKKASSQKGTYLALRDVVEYFNEFNILTVVIGGSQDLSYGIAEAFKRFNHFSCTVIDAILDVKIGHETFSSKNFITKIIASNPTIFQFNLIGFQSHLVSESLLSKVKGINQNLRLGLLKEDLMLAEPILRNTDFLSFDFGSIKSSEVAGSKQTNPNGLLSREACELAKYAGFSDRMKVFGLFEVDVEKDKSGITEALAAQIIWYFIEGFAYKSNENIQETKNKTIFKVEIKDLEKPIVFYKCEHTDRWWFEIETLETKCLIACSKKVYEQAASNEIPELWIKYIQKTDETSK